MYNNNYYDLLTTKGTANDVPNNDSKHNNIIIIWYIIATVLHEYVDNIIIS